MKKKSKRKFAPVPKTKKGTPTKYVRGAKNPKAREREIMRTKKLYKEGKSTLGKVYQRGLGAYYSSGSRPGVTAHQWAAGRVRSYATGKGGARKADADLRRGGKKKTKKKK